jgi:hypothetical protein
MEHQIKHQQDNIRLHANRLSLGIAMALCLPVAQAGSIDKWNLDNVTTEAAPRIPGEVYNSFVYTDASKTATNGGIVWVESDVQAPGMKVVTDGDGNNQGLESCIMTAGVNPVDGTTKQCNDPFQTSKRFKRVSRNVDGSVDLVFYISPGEPADAVYRILEKYENLTPGRIASFNVQLGTGTDTGFVESTADDGLAFTSRDGSPPPPTNDSGAEGINLDALFAFGLFGDEATNDNQTVDGYYDPFDRARFLLSAGEDEIAATAVSANIAGLYGGTVGSWVAKSQAPFGFFFDDDGDPLTDPITVADLDGRPEDGQGWQTYRLCDDPIAIQAGLAASGECAVADASQATGVAPAPLSAATIAAWIADPLYSVGAVEDFGNVNLNYHMTVSDDFATSNSTFTLRITPVAGDDSAGAPWNDVLPWESEVAITKLKVPNVARAGQTRKVSVTVRNNGPDEVVTGEVFLKAVNADGSVGARFTGVLDNLRSGRKTTVTFSWPVPADPQTVTWEASVEAFAAEDPVPENNEATAQTTVQ